MIATEKTVSNPYANDRDYDAFRGRVVGEYTVKRVDRQRNCTIWTTYEVIDIGRADPIVPGDPDLVIADEDPWEEPKPVVVSKPQGKTRKLFADMYEQLQAKPLSTRELADANGVTLNRVALLMDRYPDAFEQVGKNQQGALWGIRGRKYERVYTKSMPRIMEFLRKNGPATTEAICQGLGINRSTFMAAAKDNPGALKVVDRMARQGSCKKLHVYGVAGIHDVQQVQA